MSRRALRVLRVERTVSDLGRSAAFYTGALGFVDEGEVDAPRRLAALLGADRIRQVTLRRGENILVLQRLALTAANPAACDQGFQHIALPVQDMDQAMDRLRRFAPALISRGGPQHLPPASGGATAVKFRDPDGNPVELIRFADGRAGGIDHSAIVSKNVGRSIGFYRDTLGLRVAARQTNHGVEQDRLDGLDGVTVEVVALEADAPTPHIELLGYRRPPVRRAAAGLPSTRLVLEMGGMAEPEFVLDPDGHGLVLLPVH